MRSIIFYLFCGLAIVSCDNNKEATISKNLSEAERIIALSIEKSGNELFEKSKVSFDFRDKKYEGERKGGMFTLERSFKDSLGFIKDTYTNDEFVRTIDDKAVSVPDTMRPKYEQSINSVFYFAQLPYKLDDPAVVKSYLGVTKIKGVDYHKIKISFQKEGGGQDYDDNFIYWINTSTSFIEYLAYEYATNGGGMRFREHYNERIIDGMRFVDAINMKPKVKGSVTLEEIDKAFEQNLLVELSKIELENIAVKIL